MQRVHILRGCLSDPEVGEGTLYRFGGTLQLNYTEGEGAAAPIWIPERGPSQQEGFHFHQAQWVTGNRVSCEAQAMTGVVPWNFRRLVDLKLPGVELPAVFDPVLIAELNNLSAKAKYPALQVTNGDTGERFGLDYVEPGCRPVPVNWDKHKTQPSMAAAVAKETEHPAAVEATDRQETSATVREAPSSLVPILSFHEGSDVKFQPPWRPSSAPAARTGPMKTGGIVQVLDHGRWTEGAIDGLLIKHHGAPRMLKQVDDDYAAMVQRGCTDPHSLLHPTTCQHISRYVKHLARKKTHQLLSEHQPREGVGDTAAVAELDHRQPNGQCAGHHHASCNRQPSSCGSSQGGVTEPGCSGEDGG
ncbi:uncharacterized protein LOC130202399 [Pseudoliparis swirei]|uniref:uncharacterized protein LOC130202399 n=1 Tax=Pseudoliparis swirei TaxID=2059687 RepID=UPI0024BD729A|nr:uncharacterized protein LOC130202399 [Pseudoliparis swirei]